MTVEGGQAQSSDLRAPLVGYRLVLAAALYGLFMAGFCWASIVVPRLLGRGEGIWPANALTLTILMLTPTRQWPVWLASAGLGNVAAGMISGESLAMSGLMTGCNLIEIAGAAVTVRRLVGERLDVSRADHLWRFALVAGVAAPLVSASLAALALGGLRGDDEWFTFGSWVAADGLGAVILAPLLLTLRDQRRWLAATPLSPRAWGALAGLAFVTALVFSVRQPLAFLIPPALLLVVFQLEVIGAAWGVLIILGMAVAFTAAGLGPIAGHQRSAADDILAAQLFLAAITLTSLPTATALAQRRRLQAEVLASAAQTAELYRRAKLAEEVAGVGYWRMETVGGKIAWSETLAAAFGVEPDHPPDVDLILSRLPDEDRPGIGQMIEAARASEEAVGHQFRIDRPDGTQRHMLCRTAAERDAKGDAVAVFGATIDITEMKKAEAEVAESEARYRLVTEASSDIVLKFDACGRIMFASQAARQFGYEPADLIGRNAFDLIHPQDLEAINAGFAALVADVRPSRGYNISEFRARQADGGWVWVEGNPSVIRDEAGEPIAFVNALRDITKRKAMEDELRAARAAAEAAAQVKGEFLANMSHELRTPLTSVIGFTRLALEQPDLSENSRDYIAKASSAGAALLSTVNDILDFSKLESGQLQIRLEPSDPAAVCRETLDLFSQGAAEKGLRLRFTGTALPERLALDPNRLRQLLLNLIGNAVKFSEAGEIEVAASWRAADQRLTVSVADQGPGIALEQQSLLFRRFSQVDGSSTRRHGGTGLGLAICRGLVEAMGGAIGVQSEPGRGARFHFEIPAEPAGPAEAEASEIELVFPVGARVLVADDHSANRELVRAVLTPFGAVVSEAANGAEAVRAAESSIFDLILMDLRMPELDGLAAMRAIRSGRGPNRSAPILAFSAGADAPGASMRRAAGFDGDLSKPVLPADLVAAVCRHALPDGDEEAAPRRGNLPSV
ncbi:PAS domain S-box protein [Phenylobacterium montanum]|uniref:histidine kinase n=1 Tax=Phenylobacterium montanum TaxID=2823693 RepID=A0A975FX06_9CAUL|nr:PAS domain S-box protein [Caulobacter sp. S6]QUD86514.1 PAS domain S-box protein [Caulobacter sp. S6]